MLAGTANGLKLSFKVCVWMCTGSDSSGGGPCSVLPTQVGQLHAFRCPVVHICSLHNMAGHSQHQVVDNKSSRQWQLTQSNSEVPVPHQADTQTSHLSTQAANGAAQAVLQSLPMCCRRLAVALRSSKRSVRLMVYEILAGLDRASPSGSTALCTMQMEVAETLSIKVSDASTCSSSSIVLPVAHARQSQRLSSEVMHHGLQRALRAAAACRRQWLDDLLSWSCALVQCSSDT